MTNFEYERLHHEAPETGDHRVDPGQLLEIAAKEKKSTIEYPRLSGGSGIRSKEGRSLAIRTRKAGFPMEKKTKDFDFGFQASLNKGVINDMASLKFIHHSLGKQIL